MTNEDIRQVIADALGYASVPRFRGSSREAAFLSGAEDVPLATLEIDSLAAMELCIAIETIVGVSILPQQLAEIGSLNALVTTISGAL
ncbi:MAG: hypothetical protein JWQ89_1085 [Devosia sp.]|uniref:acyl carrier protein n=1 Tax=Devosia sp. TaxID=1871048 RepID=UPI0026217A44|nr:acyl carrier protein [Devosia sp.]MDB5539358.1 hypothetical protein [Devosia sp.]